MNISGTFRTLGVLGTLMVCLGLGPSTKRPSNAEDETISIEVGQFKRTFLLHLPSNDADERALPLVIALHGANSDGRAMRKMSGFDALADRNGFAVAYPNGLAGQRTWNSLFGHVPEGQGILSDEVDDVEFIRQLILTLRKSNSIDPSRVYVCGFSAGAYMTYRLAIELPDLIAAVGVVNGSIGVKSVNSKPTLDRIPEPDVPISLIHVRGASDRMVNAEGGSTPKNRFLSTENCVSLFVRADECKSDPTLIHNNEGSVTRSVYGHGKRGTEVQLVVVDHCGHAWPGRSTGFATSEELWKFFKGHAKHIGALDTASNADQAVRPPAPR